jgi:hypothetical protein
MTDSALLSTALACGAAGLPLVPCHGVMTDGSCTCPDKKCKWPGDHPRTPNGLGDATTDPEKIREWWTKWPKAKIIIATGAPDIIAETARGEAETVCPSPRSPTSNEADDGGRS